MGGVAVRERMEGEGSKHRRRGSPRPYGKDDGAGLVHALLVFVWICVLIWAVVQGKGF